MIQTVGGGIGLAYTAMPALIMSAAPVGETAAANSLTGAGLVSVLVDDLGLTGTGVV